MNNNVMLFSRDPGGADTIIPLVTPMIKSGYKVKLFGKDYALKKYSDSGLSGKEIGSASESTDLAYLSRIIDSEAPDILITGTSVDDMTEKYLWKAAEKSAVRSVAILDNWVNYGIRFSKYGLGESALYLSDRSHDFLPDRIFVMDETARDAMISDGIPSEKVIVTGQPHFEWLRDRTAVLTDSAVNIKKDAGNGCSSVVTFVSEPFSQVYGSQEKASAVIGFNEYDIARQTALSLEKAAKKADVRIALIIKLHPKEDLHKYELLEKEFTRSQSIKIIVDGSSTSIDLIAASDAVVGMVSMALVEAAVLGKPVLSVRIGMKGQDSFILAMNKACLNARDTRSLDEAADLLVSNKADGLAKFEVIKDPVERIIAFLRRNKWEN